MPPWESHLYIVMVPTRLSTSVDKHPPKRSRLGIVPIRSSASRNWSYLALAICIAGSPIVANSADGGKEKEKKEKVEKVETWTEVRTPHFVVISDGGEKMARHYADVFSGVRDFLLSQLPDAHAGNGIPIEVVVAKDDKAFAKVFFSNIPPTSATRSRREFFSRVRRKPTLPFEPMRTARFPTKIFSSSTPRRSSPRAIAICRRGWKRAASAYSAI